MFETTGARAICARDATDNGYSLVSGAGASTSLNVPQARSQTARTITGPAVPFPMVDPYSPVKNAGVPVPGYNVWPRRANRLGRKFYGLSGGDALTLAVNKAIKGPAKGFGGLGAFEPGWDAELGLPPVMPAPSSGSSSGGGGGIDWGRIISQGIQAAPAIIQTARGNLTPTGFYDRTTGAPIAITAAERNQIATRAGYHYNSSGELVKDAASNITDFISENPLLVGGGILAAVLLFMRPPGRR